MDKQGYVSDFFLLDFEQAKTKHLLFKSRLRSILYGAEIDNAPVVSQYECAVGKWIYGHALTRYGHIPEMRELEKVHADIHESARHLIGLFNGGKVKEARQGLESMEMVADALISLLSTIEIKLKEKPSADLIRNSDYDLIDINRDLHDLQKANYDLDRRIREQSKELFTSKERFELVAKATQDAVWDWDLKLNLLWWNDGFKELFGYKEGDIEPGIESWYNRIHPDDKDRVVKGIHDVIDKGGKNWSDEYRFKRSDDTYANIYDRGYALHDTEGKPFRMVGSIQDISIRKNAEEKSRFIIEAMPQKVWTADSNGDVNYFNKHWLDYTGLTIEDLKGWGWKSIIHPEDWDQNQQRWLSSITTGKVFEFEHRFLRKDGQYRWHLSRGIPQLDDRGKVVLWVGTNTDIDDQKMIERDLENRVNERTKALKEANERLEKSNMELEQFAYVTSHDLQEPLRKIRIFANMLTEKFSQQIGSNMLIYLEKIEAAASRMSGLIKDLLEYSRLSANESLYQPVDLNKIINNVVTDFELLIAQKNITIQAETLPMIEAVPLQMNQLFYNLIGNSIKFTRKSKQPIIKISAKKLPENLLIANPALKKNIDYYEIQIEDNGIGFSQEYAEQIFTIFQRLNDKTLYGGYGIGLALCRKIVENHNGIIYASGKVNEGAIFSAILPSIQNQSAACFSETA